jgi:hypothetical protein
LPRSERGFAASSPEYAEQQRGKEDHDKDEEQDLRNFGCATRDPAKTKKCRDDRDDEKDDSVSKHEALQRVDYRIGLRAGLTPSAALTAVSRSART